MLKPASIKENRQILVGIITHVLCWGAYTGGIVSSAVDGVKLGMEISGMVCYDK